VKRFATAKRRLGDALDEPAKRAVLEGMLIDVLAAISQVSTIERTIVITAEPVASDLALESGAEVLAERAEEGHPAAASAGAGRARASGATAALMLAGDCPLMEPGEVGGLLERHDPPHVAIVPDRHGTGTNGLLVAPPDAIGPAFGPGSRARHEDLADRAGVHCSVEELPSLRLDLDTADDLAMLHATLRADPRRAPATSAALGL
jgi:2-phospho-L-lactate guanylyltransferase